MSNLPVAIDYSPEQIQLIKNTVAVGATDNELGLFLQVCKNHKLDPFTRQIHFVKRAGKGTIQISIDGLRAIAERTEQYAGNDDPVFDSETAPKKATVTVWKMVSGQRCPFTATARWSQYYPKGSGFMWDKMPHLMLGKCAEALALRKAFPESMSGLYTDDEMEQETMKVEAETREVKPVEVPKVAPPKKKPTKQQAMEVLNNCISSKAVDVVLASLQKYDLGEDKADIEECAKNVKLRLNEIEVAEAEELAKSQ